MKILESVEKINYRKIAGFEYEANETKKIEIKYYVVPTIDQVLEKANFKQAQNLEIEKKYLESARQYQIFGTQNKKSELAATAFYNAAINFERAGKNKEAIEFYYKWGFEICGHRYFKIGQGRFCRANIIIRAN